MQLSFYFDVNMWTDSSNVYTFTKNFAPPKARDAIRYKVDVEVPDPAQPDIVIQGQPVKEE